MMRKWMWTGAGLSSLALLFCAQVPAAWAAPQQTQQSYTLPEYNAYQACAKESNLQQRVKSCDDFVAKYPGSTLLPYAYVTYYLTYNELKNYPKVVEYTDKELGFADKIDAGTKLQAIYLRTLAFNNSFNDKAPDAKEQASKARDYAAQGVDLLTKLPKPEGVSDDDFKKNKQGPLELFNYTAGFTSLFLKDYKAAVDSFKAALAVNPNGAVTYFRLGVAYLQMEPPQYMDGFWALARSIALKGPGEAQVRQYLRGQLLRYEQPGCEKLLDSQTNELITLASNSPERPATYSIPSAADLQKARESTTNFVADLKAGGDKAKQIWLATCGLEFPEVVGKVLEVNAAEPVALKVYSGASQEEMDAATAPNMEVKLEAQPEAKRLQKDDYIRFSGTLAGYDPDPFMLHWEKAKVNPEDLEEKGGPGKRPARRPSAKKPGRP